MIKMREPNIKEFIQDIIDDSFIEDLLKCKTDMAKDKIYQMLYYLQKDCKSTFVAELEKQSKEKRLKVFESLVDLYPISRETILYILKNKNYEDAPEIFMERYDMSMDLLEELERTIDEIVNTGTPEETTYRSIDEYREDIKGLQKSIESQQKEIGGLEKDIEILKKKKKEKEENDLKIKKLQTEREQLQKDCELSSDQKCQKLKSEIDKLRKQKASMQKKENDLKDELKDLNDVLGNNASAEVKQSIDTAIKQLQKTIQGSNKNSSGKTMITEGTMTTNQTRRGRRNSRR